MTYIVKHIDRMPALDNPVRFEEGTELFRTDQPWFYQTWLECNHTMPDGILVIWSHGSPGCPPLMVFQGVQR